MSAAAWILRRMIRDLGPGSRSTNGWLFTHDGRGNEVQVHHPKRIDRRRWLAEQTYLRRSSLPAGAGLPGEQETQR